MSEKKSDTDDVDVDFDAGWDEEGEPLPTTRTVESVELLRAAGMARAGSPPAGGEESPSSDPRGADMMATVPPPVPTSEYVATMMGRAPESDVRASQENQRQPAVPTLADRHRAILRTLHEEDPLRFDFDDQAATFVSEAPPSIETTEVGVEIDPELLIDTPVPPRPPSDTRVDELDELPVDEMLLAISHQPLGREPMTTLRSRAVTNPEPPRPAPDLPSPPPPREAGRAIFDFSFTPTEDDPKPAISDPPFDPMPPPLRIPNIPSFAFTEDTDEDDGPRDAMHNRVTLPGYDPDDPIEKVHERFVVGDYSGALVLAEGVLEESPGHTGAQKYAESCRDMLRQMYLARIGSGKQTARVVMEGNQLRWLTLDHRAGFLLSCIDGTSSIDEILDVSGMPPLDALRILYELVQEGVVAVSEPEPG